MFLSLCCAVSGRSPNVDALNLEAAGVEVDDKKGHINVDDYQVSKNN